MFLRLQMKDVEVKKLVLRERRNQVKLKACSEHGAVEEETEQEKGVGQQPRPTL